MAKKKATKKKATKKKTPVKKTAAKKKPAKKKAATKRKTTKKKAPVKKATTKKKAVAKKVTSKKKKVTKKKATRSTKKTATKKATANKATKKKKAEKKKAPAKKATAKSVAIAVDQHCKLKNAVVVGDWDAMLNQTNIGANNNKFYVIQLVQTGTKYRTWTRWGRVGETGQSTLLGSGSLESAEREFEKKFKSKTGNAWQDRSNFKPKKGKYALIEIDRSAEANQKAGELEDKLKQIDSEAANLQTKVKYADSKLDKRLESLMTLIFDHKMFQGAMASFDIDVKKMPLGQLKKNQVQKGYDVLERLEKAVDSKRAVRINELSSEFYTLIPHAFGRKVPPPINTSDLLQKKFEMLNVLNDIEIALGMQKKATRSKAKLLPNPADSNFATLKAKMDYVDPAGEEYAMIERYLSQTSQSSYYYKPKLVDVFRIDRDGSQKRFDKFNKIKQRKLLWHGTNVAVVAAIIGSGLRIMPHSGGRVGKGIYMASECGKSVSYVGWSGNSGVMFLVEAALGKEHTITKDDWRLKAPPKGFDSIVARGETEPDPKDDITHKFGKHNVVVPQGKPIKQRKFKKSYFSESEYLVYNEAQVKIRYVLRVRH